jgi:hypothetical protein
MTLFFSMCGVLKGVNERYGRGGARYGSIEIYNMSNKKIIVIPGLTRNLFVAAPLIVNDSTVRGPAYALRASGAKG